MHVCLCTCVLVFVYVELCVRALENVLLLGFFCGVCVSECTVVCVMVCFAAKCI